jgi:glutathione S-transferase
MAIVLRILSYLPNPRLWKATVTARIAGLKLEIVGASPNELRDWLWDFDAHPLTEAERSDGALRRAPRAGFTEPLYKTDAFLAAHPFGTVPAAFSPDGKLGVFESNSIMRAVARAADPALGLYGRDAYAASRIDSFLDASLVFAREAQAYLLALRSSKLSKETRDRAADAFGAYVAGIDQALTSGQGFIAGTELTIADICFAAELALFANELPNHQALARLGYVPIWTADLQQRHSNAWAHFTSLARHPSFSEDFEPYLRKVGVVVSG